MRTLLLSVLGASGLLSLSVGARVTPPADRKPVSLHPAVRAVLDTRMETHAIEMTDLVMLVVMLERDDAADAASRLAAEPRIARPVALGDANAGIPDGFFAYQEELSLRADALATAARTGTDPEMARAFGDLTAVCIACHSRYLPAD